MFQEIKEKYTKLLCRDYGGLAIIAGFLVSTIYLIIVMNLEKTIGTLGVDNYLTKLLGFFAGAFVLSSFCFIDDLKNIRPIIKLTGQVLAATIIALSGIRIDQVNIASLNTVLNVETISILITILWIVGITNAINLLDGLDGLSSGIALISCISLTIIFALNGSPLISIILITALARCNCRIFTF